MKIFATGTIVLVLLSLSPAIAQRTYPETFRPYSARAAYMNFSAKPNLCEGQILDQGLICILDLAKEKRTEKRVAALKLLFGRDQGYETLITIRTFEMGPNKADIAYVVIIRRYVTITKSDLPLLLAFVKKDGSVSIDSTYGDFPPQFSAKKESLSTLEEYKGEIRKLIAALKKPLNQQNK